MRWAFWRHQKQPKAINERTVCFECLAFLTVDGYAAINNRTLQLLEKGVRCDFCERREKGKLLPSVELNDANTDY